MAIKEGVHVTQGVERNQTLSRRKFLKAAGVGIAGGLVAADYLLKGPVTKAVEGIIESVAGDIAIVQENTPHESAYLLPTLSEEEIKEVSFIPKGESLSDKYLHTVSPILQERAQRAGYHLIYQGDPGDTSGRTVLFSTERSINNQYYDIGFGWWFSLEVKTIKEAPGVSIRGIFQGWVIPPDWEEGNKGVYILLKDPTRGNEFLVRMNQARYQKCMWLVDNLDIGGDPVPLEAYATIHSFLSSLNLYGKESEVIKIRTPKQLDQIIRPGDVLEPFGGIIEGPSIPFPFDKHDIFTPSLLYLRRFGGIEQLRKEIRS